MHDPQDRGSSRSKTGSRRYEIGIVAVLTVVLAALWILSSASVRAHLASRAWANGDVAGAYRLAAMATRQRPDMADMWLLQARCEERLDSPCQAALSYARAVLAASEQQARQAAPSAPEATPVANSAIERLRSEALAAALQSAAACPSITATAAVFEALTVGLPSDPEQRDGYWPGEPEIAGNRESPTSLIAALPDDPVQRLRWVEFLWRRGERSAAGAAARQWLASEVDTPAAGLAMLGRILSETGDAAAADHAFRRALEIDGGWLPAAAVLAEMPPNSQRLALATATVDAAVWELRDADLLLATNGSVTFTLETAGSERVFVMLEVTGSPANGRYPEITPSINGNPRPSFEATDSDLPIVLEVPTGGAAATISFSFVNDWADDTGDRNVFFGVPTVLRRVPTVLRRVP